MAIRFIHFSCHLDMPGPAEARAAVDLFHRLRAEDNLRRIPQARGFEVEQQDAPTGTALLFRDDDGGDPEALVAFVLRLAQAFDLHGLWGFQHGRWCSRREIEAFGGGAHLVDLGARRLIGQVSSDDWLEAGLKAAQDRAPQSPC